MTTTPPSSIKRVVGLLVLVSLLIGNISPSALAVNVTSTNPDSVGIVGFYTSIGIGTDGFARISYRDFSNTNLKYLRCTDNACTSPVLTTVDSSGDVGDESQLVIGSDGFARIAYRDLGTSGLKFAQCTNNDCTSANITTIASGIGGYMNTMALGNDGLPRIAYRDHNNYPQYVRCTNQSCTTNVQTALPQSNEGYRSSIAIGLDGYARILHTNVNFAELKLTRCTDDNCTSPVISTLLTGSASQEGYKSMAIGADGFPRIVYKNSSLTTIDYLRCTNADCSSRVTTTLETTSAGGRDVTLKLGSDGLPHIAYSISNNTYVKYIQCGNQDCTGTTPLLVDSGTNLGAFLSLALTSTNKARFSYYYGATQDLKYTQCTTGSCNELAIGSALSDATPGATYVEQSFTITLGNSIENGGTLKLNFPNAFSTDFASLTSSDVSISGTNITSATKQFDTTQNRITFTLNTTGATSAINITIGDGASGGLADLGNPNTAGSYSVGFSSYTSTNQLIEQGITFIEIGTGILINASVSDALVMTLSNTGISLNADPSVNNGKDISQYTIITAATNALSGYSIYGKLDDGSGNARLISGGNTIPSGTGENTLSYKASNATYSSHTFTGDALFANVSSMLNSQGTNIAYPSPTNSQNHTIYYDLNVDYTTPAGTYTGIITYTAIGSF